MAKRFIETTIWTQNKWFRKLRVEYKLVWFYILTNCDTVGVWEDDFELASFIIGFDYDKADVYKSFEGKIKVMNDRKIWIVDFCNFQYGELKEENIKNRPHQSYIALLKNHRLWIDYTKSLQRLKDKDKDKEQDKDINIPFEDFWNLYDKKRGDKVKLEKKWNNLTDIERNKIIDYIPKYKESQPDKAFRKDPETFLNNKSWNDEIIKNESNGKSTGSLKKVDSYWPDR